MIDHWGIFYETAFRLMSLDLPDDKSTSVQVMDSNVKQQAITWANSDPDICCHKVLAGHNELT